MRRGTYSIVARDPASGELGVAVQSHWFSVGGVVAWARPGVGAVATQSVAEIAHGPNALDRMQEGLDARAAIAAGLRAHRQRAYPPLGARGAGRAAAADTGHGGIPCPAAVGRDGGGGARPRGRRADVRGGPGGGRPGSRRGLRARAAGGVREAGVADAARSPARGPGADGGRRARGAPALSAQATASRRRGSACASRLGSTTRKWNTRSAMLRAAAACRGSSRWMRSTVETAPSKPAKGSRPTPAGSQPSRSGSLTITGLPAASMQASWLLNQMLAAAPPRRRLSAACEPIMLPR